MAIKSQFPAQRPTADFNFSATKTLDSRITFSRASTATYYDGRTLAKAEENLLLGSASLIAQSVYTYDKVYTISFVGTGSVTLSGAHSATLTGTGTSDRVSLTFTPTKANLTLTPSGAVNNAQLEQRDFVGPYTATTTTPITNWQPALLTAPAGVPRFQHDPATGKSLGFLSERQATNLLAESEFYNGIQTAGGVTLGKMFSPSGEVANAAVFSPGATSNFLYPKTTLTVSANTIYAASVFVKMDDGLAPSFGNAIGPHVSNDFYLVVGNTPIPPTGYTVQPVGNGLYRVSGAVTTGTVNLGNHYIFRQSANSGKGFRVTGWQIEQHSRSTSYIKTEGSQVTRLADSATIEGTALDSFYNQRGGTVIATAILKSVPGTAQVIFGLDFGNSTVNRLNSYVSAGVVTGNYINNAASGSPLTPASVMSDQTNSIAIRVADNNFGACLNGGAVGTSAGILGIKTKLGIGCTAYTSNDRLDNPIARFAYYDELLSDAQLQALCKA